METVKLNQIFARTIERREEARIFYECFFMIVQDQTAKKTLQFSVSEEKKHEEFLEGYLRERKNMRFLVREEVVDYKITEYLEILDYQKDLRSSEVYLTDANRGLNNHSFCKNKWLPCDRKENSGKSSLMVVKNKSTRERSNVFKSIRLSPKLMEAKSERRFTDVHRIQS